MKKLTLLTTFLLWCGILLAGHDAPQISAGIGVPLSGGTAGSSLFVGTGGVLSQNNANYFWDNTNKRLGIGTNVPAAQVDILQPNATSGLPIALSVTGGAHTGLGGDNYTSALFNFGQTVTFEQNDLNQLQNLLLTPSTFAFTGSSVLGLAASAIINGIPGQGANADIVNSIGLAVLSGSTTSENGVSEFVGLPGIANGKGDVNSVQGLTIGQGSGNQVSLGNQTAGLVDLIYANIMPDTVVSAVNTRTASGKIAGLYVSGPPVAGAGILFGSTPYSFWIDSGTSRFDGWRIDQQNSIAAANDFTPTSNTIYVTGATQINRLAAPPSSSTHSATLTLIFASNPVVKHNQASGGGFFKVLLAGSADYATATNGTLTLQWDSVNSAWQEMARKAP